jgi:hypothetical protein
MKGVRMIENSCKTQYSATIEEKSYVRPNRIYQLTMEKET